MSSFLPSRIDKQFNLLQLWATYLQKKLKRMKNGKNFTIKFKRGQNISYSQQVYTSDVPQFDIVIMTMIQTNRIAIRAYILKNGEYFRVKEQSRITQIMYYINEASKNAPTMPLISIHPSTSILVFKDSHTVGALMGSRCNAALIIDHILSRIQGLKRIIKYWLKDLLYLSGQISQLYYFQAKNENFTHPSIKEINSYLQKVSEIITPDQVVKEYHLQSTKVKQPDITGLSLPPESEKQRTTADGKRQRYIQNITFLPENFLKQQPYHKSNPNQKLNICSHIILDTQKNQEEGVNWAPLNNMTHFDLYGGECLFSYHLGNGNFKSQSEYKINKNMALKRYKEESRHKAERQMFFIEKIGKYTSNFIGKYYQIQNQTLKEKYQNCIVMDFYKKSLHDYNLNFKGIMSLSTKLTLLTQIVQGLRVLRDCFIVHMDLKPDNIMISQDLSVKIIDFGESVSLAQRNKFDIKNRSLPYVAPQFWNKNRINNSFDVYSLGVMIDELMRGSFIFPFRRKSLFEVLERSLIDKTYPNFITLNVQKYLEMFSPHVAQLVFILVLLCLHPRPQERPTLDVVCIILKIIQEIRSLEILS